MVCRIKNLWRWFIAFIAVHRCGKSFPSFIFLATFFFLWPSRQSQRGAAVSLVSFFFLPFFFKIGIQSPRVHVVVNPKSHRCRQGNFLTGGRIRMCVEPNQQPSNRLACWMFPSLFCSVCYWETSSQDSYDQVFESISDTVHVNDLHCMTSSRLSFGTRCTL